MELLAGELRLLKSEIDLISGRLELLLAEIAHLQGEDQSGTEEYAGQPTLQSARQASAPRKLDACHVAGPFDTASQCTSPAPVALDDAQSVASENEEELPTEPLVLADQNAVDSHAHTPMPSVAASAIFEALPVATPEVPEAAIAAERDSACIAQPNVGGDAPNIIVLDERRKTSPRRNAVRALTHCAASLAMIALVVAVATSSGLAEFLASKARSTPDSVRVAIPASAL
jgi:hypothetical protein